MIALIQRVTSASVRIEDQIVQYLFKLQPVPREEAEGAGEAAPADRWAILQGGGPNMEQQAIDPRAKLATFEGHRQPRTVGA